MDSLEFIHRFREAQQAAGNRPVEVKFQTSQAAKGISIRYEPAPFVIQNDMFSSKPGGLELPSIVITHPL